MLRHVLAAATITVLLAACGSFGAERWEEVPTNWTLESVDGAELTLSVEIGSSTCDRNPRIAEVTEEDAYVTIRAVRETWVNADMCTTDLGFATIGVELSEPLGERFLEGCWADGRDLFCGPFED